MNHEPVMPQIPAPAERILAVLSAAGHEAWLVGGWVRDAVMGRPAHDVDIATSALWEQAAATLSSADIKVFETGIAHGTITARVDGMNCEITTYRTESGYSDRRHPDEVRFVRSIEQDLARRDFTINAMAYHPSRGLFDPYGGQSDIARAVVRAVGDANARFHEDGLRVLRAVRFAASLGFELERDSAAAAAECSPLLASLAPERIAQELDILLASSRMGPAMRRYPQVICAALPELRACYGFDQKSTYHCYDVYDHLAYALDALEVYTGGVTSRAARWATLLHDIGKPACFSQDETGAGHFYGHPAEGERITTAVMRRLALGSALSRRASALVGLHDRPITATEKSMGRLFAQFSNRKLTLDCALIHELFAIKRADSLSHARPYRDYALELDELERYALEVWRSRAAFRVKDLAVDGHALMEHMGQGPGPWVGAALNAALEEVLEGRIANTKDELLAYIETVGKETSSQV